MSQEGNNNTIVNADILSSLTEYIIRVCVAVINNDSLNDKLVIALAQQDSVDILARFISSGESSIVFIEDATSVGGEGNYFIFYLLFNAICLFTSKNF